MEIKTEEEYEEYLLELEDLIAADPPDGTYESDRMKQLMKAIEEYEESESN